MLQLGCGDTDESSREAVGKTTETPAVTDAEGEQIYAQYCAACHGIHGEGIPDRVNDLRDGRYARGQLSTLEIFEIVKNGQRGEGGTMPPWGGILSDAQIIAVLEYMDRTFSEN